MRYLIEVRTFIISMVGLLVVVAVAGFFVVLRFDDTLKRHYWNECQSNHILTRTIIEGNGNPLQYQNLLEGYVLQDAGRGVLHAHPRGAVDYYMFLKNRLEDELPVSVTPLLLSGSEDLNPLAFHSSLPDGRHLITYHENPLPGLSRSLLIFFAILTVVAIGVPILTFFFLTGRITRPFQNLLSQAEKSPLAPGGLQDDPEFILKTLQATIRELEAVSKKEKARADALHVLAATLSKNLPSGLIVLDDTARIIRMSRSAAEVLERDESQLPCPVEELLEGWPNLQDAVSGVHDSKVTLQREEIFEGERIFAATIVPLFDEENAHMGTLVLFVDRTEMVRMEEELRRQKNAVEMGLFASGIAHEFRNSIATIQGFLSLYRKKGLSQHIEEIEQEASHILQVTNRFLQFASQRVLEKEEVDLIPLIRQIIGKISSAHPDTDVAIEGDGACRVDPTLLEQALRNILENSFEVSRKVVVTVERAGKECRLTVSDDGPGLPESIRETLYLPFVSSKPEGVGLGLAIARKIIEEHEGTLSHVSGEVGGTTCVITLPGV